MSSIDINNVISIVLLGLSSWTLYTVHNLAKDASGEKERLNSIERQGHETRSRLIEAESDIDTLKIDVAVLKKK